MMTRCLITGIAAPPSELSPLASQISIAEIMSLRDASLYAHRQTKAGVFDVEE
jgi:hypothetical protein